MLIFYQASPAAGLQTQAIQNDEFCIENDELCIENDEFCIENDEFCIENDEFCIENDEFCIENDEFCSSLHTLMWSIRPGETRSVTPRCGFFIEK